MTAETCFTATSYVLSKLLKVHKFTGTNFIVYIPYSTSNEVIVDHRVQVYSLWYRYTYNVLVDDNKNKGIEHKQR